MAGKLEANGLWESSRMMLPEHKAAILRAGREQHRQMKPILDPQEMEEIERLLDQSLRSHVQVTLRIYGEYETRELRGIVTSIHTHSREIKLQWQDGWEWIRIKEILGAYE
ncbi:hypothetical protein J2Z69_003589 [Paenibacillus shirakamiensis]|uniref:YolD-like family protein n=1 Tax=Paenibacillus shirakamiensis TaxID=1265935 RepID=A0ABS4JLD4_9BACL|nr:YolD-like family protein [Paenibacillus shirakamiensis]MBP2002503.1 hypothetical protein [Paenibacillus shirakamiensis]